MSVARPPGRGWSRRAFLLFHSLLRLPAASRKGVTFAAEWSVYADPTTEFSVTRLTAPTHDSGVPCYAGRFLSSRRNFLLYSSNRTGSWQAYQCDLKTGESRLLTEAQDLVRDSLSLMPDDRRFLYFDGGTLQECEIGTLKEKRLHEIPERHRLGEGFSLDQDGRRAVWVETDDAGWHIRSLDLRRGRVTNILTSDREIRRPMLCPGRDQVLYRMADQEPWVADLRGKNRSPLKTAAGRTGPALWSAGGAAVLYLNYPEDRSLHAVREYFPGTRQDRLIARTTQFVALGANADSSVLVGASGSRATPFVLLLLRRTGRELTLCEHHASRPETVCPVFSPSNRHIVFQSDRDGRGCLYSIKVDQLVEATET
jgi:oligogalacturonide lyase